MSISKGDQPRRIVRVIAKKETQRMIRALRSAGLTVTKTDCGVYMCEHTSRNKQGEEETTKLFTAMPGSRGYLVHMQQDLFTN